MVGCHCGNWQKVPARTLATFAIMALSGFGYAWLAPWSDDVGILLMEPIAVGLAVVLFGAFTFLLLLVLRRLWPRWFVGGWAAVLLCTAVLLGIVLSMYLYPPMKRMLEPTQEARNAAGRLVEHLKTEPPWEEHLADKSLQSVQWKVAPAPKGFFGWSPRDPWIIRLTFHYQDGVVAKATYHMSHRITSLEGLTIEQPDRAITGENS